MPLGSLEISVAPGRKPISGLVTHRAQEQPLDSSEVAQRRLDEGALVEFTCLAFEGKFVAYRLN